MESRFELVANFTKKGRKYDQLWFIIEPKNQVQSELITNDQPIWVSNETLTKLTEFGLDADEISMLTARNDEEYLLAQIDYTAKRLKKKDADSIGSVKAYFLSSVEKNYADAPRRPDKIVVEKPKSKPQEAHPSQPTSETKPSLTMAELKLKWKKIKLDEIRQRFVESDEVTTQAIVQDYEEQLRQDKVFWATYQKHGCTRSVIEAVVEIIYNQTYAEPTADDLLPLAITG